MYRSMMSQYPEPPGGRSAQEGFSVLEFQLRFLCLIGHAALRSADKKAAPSIPRSAGMGEWLSYLRMLNRALADRSEEGVSAARIAISATLSAFDDQSAQPMHFKALRDHLTHGGPVPPTLSAQSVQDLIDEIDEHVDRLLRAALVSFGTARTGTKRPILAWSSHRVNLWPTIFVRDQDWHVFSRASGNDAASYFVYGGDAVRSDEQSVDVLEALLEVLRVPRARGPFNTFVIDVEEDLRGFAEVGTPLATNDTDEGFEVVWEKATSEGTEVRRDYFRLGIDDRREWRDSDGWVSYSRYLRVLVRWDMVATRLHQSLLSTAEVLDREEAAALGWDTSTKTYRAARVDISDLAGSKERTCSFEEMMQTVDQDLHSNRGQTQVVFLNGEAGIGKTRAMLKEAIRRSERVANSSEKDVDFDLPLYLFVQSTGQVLDNLNTVVAGAVVRTRILTDEGVRALCRNGLMAILIDGFDELLGNARYGDALGSLRPWLSSLGGRGVMVVSARSSYYVGQYRASVSRAQQSNFPLVRHRIAEMQKWSTDEVDLFVTDFGLANEFSHLSVEDRRLLQLPFFARVFVEMCKSFGDVSREVSLAEYLLDQYVAREETKIRARDGSSILRQAELRSLFATLAELMDEQSEREADEDLLRDAAELTLGAQLITREGLAERLPALCGLSVNGGSEALRFRFQHELFFDQFLAGAAIDYFRDGHVQAFVRMLINSAWRSATISGVVANVDGDELANVLHTGSQQLAGLTEQQDGILRTNLGALWSELVRTSGRMRYDINDANFADSLDLSAAEPGWMRLQNCVVQRLILPLPGKWEIELRETRVARIDARLSARLAGLRGVQTNRVEELLHGNHLLERPGAITEALTQAGAQLDPEFTQAVSAASENARTVEYFLSALDSRAEYTIILDQKTLLPADEPAPKWTMEFGRQAWSMFVNSMTSSQFAILDRFNSSGKAKYRFRLNRAVSQILDRETGSKEIRDFWAKL